MTNEELYKNWKRAERALEKLSWRTVQSVRNANRGLYPIDWEKVKANWKEYDEPLKIKDKEQFEELLKELCDSLYNWGLYEPCPKCNKGKKIPIWSFRAYTPFCGCTNYPKCDFSMDRGGEPL